MSWGSLETQIPQTAPMGEFDWMRTCTATERNCQHSFHRNQNDILQAACLSFLPLQPLISRFRRATPPRFYAICLRYGEALQWEGVVVISAPGLPTNALQRVTFACCGRIRTPRSTPSVRLNLVVC